jgi:hypothetical protein
MPENKEPVNIAIIDGEPFFAHEMSTNFTPTQFTLDFKCITPRVDPRSKKPSFLLKHNVVMVEPYHAKMILSVLNSVIKKYEEEYGEIKKPKSIENAEKKQKKAMSTKKNTETETPSYLG